VLKKKPGNGNQPFKSKLTYYNDKPEVNEKTGS